MIDSKVPLIGKIAFSKNDQSPTLLEMNQSRDIASCNISEETIQRVVLLHYGISAQRPRLLGVSENRGYEIKDPDGKKYFARVHVFADRYAAHIPSEYDLLDRLNKSLPDSAPTGIRTKEGCSFVRFECDDAPYLLMLFSWLPGQHVSADDLSLDDAAAMAETTARFHRASRQMAHDFKRPRYDFEFYCGENSFYFRDDLRDHISAEDMTPFLKLKAIFAQYDKDNGHDGKGMIHYDLHLGNFLFENGHARIIDFDECGYGYYLFDLGHILFAQHDHANAAELESVFIEKYEAASATKLPRKDLCMFKGVQAVAIVHYFFRLLDRSDGKQNLLGFVPNVARSLNEVISEL